jgi:DNA-binding XRE family transcriptional regulator
MRKFLPIEFWSMFDFVAAEQADKTRQEALWTASKIAIELNASIQAKDADRLADAYTQSAMFHAGMTQAEIGARDEGAEKVKAFQRLINKQPELATDDDIRAAGLDPDLWRDDEENIDGGEQAEDPSAAMLPKELTYDCECDLGLTDDRGAGSIIASDVREWRTRCGFSQEDAAKKLGISSRALRDYENGKTEVPKMAALAMWALTVKYG